VAFLLRDPEREITPRADVALAPADGQVIHVGRVHDDYWDAEMLEVGIFLALWDVHIQRAPLDGVVVGQRRKAGGYRPAMTEAATHGNNQVATYLDTAMGPCTVTQISGIVARRIVTWVREGDDLEQGERLGIIKLGSQVTLRVPASAEALVEVGQAVRGGVTPIARLVPPIVGGGS
jgi:phosphatidylserine decarboxylase